MTNILFIIDSKNVSHCNEISGQINYNGYLYIIDNTLSMNHIYQNCIGVNDISKDFIINHQINTIIILCNKSSAQFKKNLKQIYHYLNILIVNNIITIVCNIQLKIDSTKYKTEFGTIEFIIKYVTNNKELNKEQHVKSNKYSYLNESNIVNTRPIGTISTDFIKYAPTISINEITDFVLIVDFYNGGGGTTTFLNSIISKYKYYNNFVIIRNIDDKILITLNDDFIINWLDNENALFEFISTHISNITMIFVNHIYGFSNQFLQTLNKTNNKRNKIIGITHDYSLIYTNPQPSYTLLHNTESQLNETNNINIFDTIVTQHKNNCQIFNKYINNNTTTIEIIPLPDYYKSYKHIQYNNNKNKNHTIGIIGNIITLKGEMQLKELINKMNNVKFVVFGLFEYNHPNLIKQSYNSINELNELLVKYKPTIMIELSIWPETYSYTLTLYSIIDLPLIILNKNDPTNVIIQRAKEYNMNYTIVNDIDEMCINIYNIPVSNKFNTIYTELQYHSKWNEMFISNYNKKEWHNQSHVLNIYPIYFPQFHSFDINNTLFYKGYTDIENLQLLYKSDYQQEIVTPQFDWFNIENISKYNLNNHKIIQRQCDLLKDYKLPGIACYYYWFSKNTFNNDNMLMRPVINQLFENMDLNEKKIFFIWANENWTSNVAMGNKSNFELINLYNYENLQKNFQNVIPYFNHNAYLKIDNKPVFMIYHSFLMTTDEIKLYITELNKLCIENGFNGVYIYLNSMKGEHFDIPDIKEFYINFNYKINTGFRYMIDNQAVIDYDKYIDFVSSHTKDNIVQTLSFDFDNNARLICPDKKKNSTICSKNYHYLKIKFIRLMIEKYKNVTNSDIVLVNSLNEWGEKMAIEPSNELGFYYLNLICSMI